MSTALNSTLNPLLSSVVHLPFRTAASQVGCCELSLKIFGESLQSHLKELSEASILAEVNGEKLWLAMMKGEVLSVEHINNEGILFHVQGRVLHNTFADMKFYYQKDSWEILGITSIHQRPFWRSRWRTVTEVGAAVVLLAAIVSFGAHSALHYTKQGVESWAKQNGYSLVAASSLQSSAARAASQPDLAMGPTKTSGTTPANVSTGNSNTTAVSTANSTVSNGSSQSKPNTHASGTKTTTSTSKTYRFTFKSGMTVHDISVFLQSRHLITNAYSFDNVLQKSKVAASIWPGTYTFKNGMTQSQLISVLKKHP